MSSFNVTITSKKGDEVTVSVPKSGTVKDLKLAYMKSAAKTPKDIHQISFKNDKNEKMKFNDNNALIEDVLGNENKVTLLFKDLGQQINYRLVFYLEYFGPMLMVAICAYFRKEIFGDKAGGFESMNGIAQLAVYCWMAHFAKRELETAFVHKFSNPTMPLGNLFKNCTYYWSFGAVIGYPLCHPSFTPPDELQVQIGLAIFVICEIGNLYTHVALSQMRPAEGSRKRDIPRGFMFDLVACPNYFFEVMSWVGFSIMTNVLVSYLFTLAGLYQMTVWALKKHKGYRDTYGDEYKCLKRKAIIPFIV